MTVLRANFSSGSVQENPLAAGVTTLTMAGNLQNLPTIVAPDFARLTIDPLGTDGLSGSGTEIVHVTAYTHGAGSSTILRGQEGTTDRPHSEGVKIVNAPTVQDWTDVITQHEAESDPHSQYATDANLATHAAASDPHPGYATDSDLSTHAAATTGVHGVGGSTVESVSGSNAKVAAHAAAGDPHPGYATDGDVTAEASTRASADSSEASTRATDDKKRPRVIGVTGGITSTPALTVDFQMQTGRAALTTTSGGQWTLNLPATFPNGLLMAQVVQDNATSVCVLILQPNLSSAGQLVGKAFDMAGGDFASSGIEVAFIAIGW